MIPLNPDDLIDSNLSAPATWKNETLGALIHQSTFSSTIGLWPFGIRYMGMRFEIGGEWHYGWVEIDSWTGVNTGYIRSYGWETDANTPIAAGAPEPARAALLLIGLISMHRRRRRALGSG